MKKKIRQALLSMAVSQDREAAETKALEICRSGNEAFGILVDMGREALKGSLQDNKELLRAISFTLSIFLTRGNPFAMEAYSSGVDLVIKFAALGFNSARNCLTHLGMTPKEIWQRHLTALPQADRHRNDKEISLNEALVEIELSQSRDGNKGPFGGRYCLGRDLKHRYDLYRIDKKRFALRIEKGK